MNVGARVGSKVHSWLTGEVIKVVKSGMYQVHWNHDAREDGDGRIKGGIHGHKETIEGVFLVALKATGAQNANQTV